MSPSLIIADACPASTPSPSGNSTCVPQNRSDFFQILQQISRGEDVAPSLSPKGAQGGAPVSEFPAGDHSISGGVQAMGVTPMINAEVFEGMRTPQPEQGIASTSPDSTRHTQIPQQISCGEDATASHSPMGDQGAAPVIEPSAGDLVFEGMRTPQPKQGIASTTTDTTRHTHGRGVSPSLPIADAFPASTPLPSDNHTCAPQYRSDFLSILPQIRNGEEVATPLTPMATAPVGAPASEPPTNDPLISVSVQATSVTPAINAEVFDGMRTQQPNPGIASVSTGSTGKSHDAPGRTILFSKAAKGQTAKVRTATPDDATPSPFVQPPPVAPPAQTSLLPIELEDDAAAVISSGLQPSGGLLEIAAEFTAPTTVATPATAVGFGAPTPRSGDVAVMQGKIPTSNAAAPAPPEIAAVTSDYVSAPVSVDDSASEIIATPEVATGNADSVTTSHSEWRAAPSLVRSKSKPSAALSAVSSPEKGYSTTEPAIRARNYTSPVPADDQIVSRLEPRLALQPSPGNSFTAAPTSAPFTADFSNGQTALWDNHSASASATGKTALAPEKPPSASAPVEHPANTALAPAISTHATAFQPAPAQPTTDSAPSTDGVARDGVAPASVVLPAQTQSSASVPVHANHKLQSNPIPDPPRMVDSGQFRAGSNSSELKISVQLPELGKVEVRAVTAHDVTTAHLTASSHDALQVIAADRSGLEQTLKSRDVILGSLDSHSQGQTPEQHRQQNSEPPAQFSARTASTAETISATSEADHAGLLADHSRISVRA